MEIPRHWRLKAQRYRLKGSACPTCGQFIFPPRPAWPSCKFQRVGIEAIPVLLISTRLTDIESHIGHQIMERMIG